MDPYQAERFWSKLARAAKCIWFFSGTVQKETEKDGEQGGAVGMEGHHATLKEMSGLVVHVSTAIEGRKVEGKQCVANFAASAILRQPCSTLLLPSSGTSKSTVVEFRACFEKRLKKVYLSNDVSHFGEPN